MQGTIAYGGMCYDSYSTVVRGLWQ